MTILKTFGASCGNSISGLPVPKDTTESKLHFSAMKYGYPRVCQTVGQTLAAQIFTNSRPSLGAIRYHEKASGAQAVIGT